MKYPNKKNNEQKHNNITYGNRGMGLETLINLANEYYLETNVAIIYKKPTDIGINKVIYKPKVVIKDAYFKSPSTLDYNGIYKGKYIEFDAKMTRNKTSFPLNNIPSHQLEHIKKIIGHGGICFLILEMNNNFYLLEGNKLIEFIDQELRKSIPIAYIEEHAHKIKLGLNPVIDYIKVLENIIKEDYFNGRSEEKKEK